MQQIRLRLQMEALLGVELLDLQEKSTLAIQCAMRGFLAKKIAGKRQKYKEEQLARIVHVCTLQRMAHGLRARLRIRRMHKSARKVQSMVRGKQARVLKIHLLMEALMAAHEWNALHYATYKKDLKGMSAAIAGTDLEGKTEDADGQYIMPCPVDSTGGRSETALHIACGQHNREAAEFLLQSGANVNVIDNNGWTPLRCAVETGQSATFSNWLVNGQNEEPSANVRLGDKERCTAVHIAAQHGEIDTLKALFEGFKKPIMRVEERCEAALTEARELNANRKLLTTLLEHLEGDMELTAAAKHAGEGRTSSAPMGNAKEKVSLTAILLVAAWSKHVAGHMWILTVCVPAYSQQAGEHKELARRSNSSCRETRKKQERDCHTKR